MKKVLIIAGLGLIIFAGVWKYLISPAMIDRLPKDWTWEANFVGIQTMPDEKTGKFPEKDITALYIRKIYITSEKKRPESVSVEDKYTIINPADKNILWEYIFKAEVDPGTGRHLREEWKDDYFVLPRFTEKKTYNFRNNYIKGVPLVYQKEEETEGINTYVFSYKGRGEYTESYEGTKDYPGTKVEPGQEIKCADDQFIFKAWVEPITGETITLQESCGSGDYIYDIKTGKQLAAVLRWSGITAGDDVVHRAEKVRKERFRILLITMYLPMGMVGAGILFFGFGFLYKKR